MRPALSGSITIPDPGNLGALAPALPLPGLGLPGAGALLDVSPRRRGTLLAMLLPWFLLLVLVDWTLRSQYLGAAGRALTMAEIALALPFACRWTLNLGTIAVLARRAPAASARWLPWLLLCAVSGLGLLAVELGGAYALGRAFGFAAAAPAWPVLLLNLVLYACLLGVALVLVFWRRYQTQEREGLGLREKLTQAQLDAARAELRFLQMEIHPHFIFNSLHSIATLMHDDAAAAQKMVVNLGDLLREALVGAETPQIPLAEELACLVPYAEIERARFGGALQLVWQVDDEVGDAFVPRMLLQPLVENAVKHAVAPRGRGTIVVTARRAGDRLLLQVCDDGDGVRCTAGAPCTGRGIANLRARLHRLYGAGASLVLEPVPTGGTRAVVDLPLCWEPAPASAWRDPPPPHAPLPRTHP